jgi:hypothetical protein
MTNRAVPWWADTRNSVLAGGAILRLIACAIGHAIGKTSFFWKAELKYKPVASGS